MVGREVELDRDVAVVRAFNRDYTRWAELITDNLLDTPHTLAEARVIFELGGGAELTAADLVASLHLDAGYLSRIVARLERDGLVQKRRSEVDGRRRLLSLTAAGRRARRTLDERSDEQVLRLLETIPGDRRSIVEAMGAIAASLAPSERPSRVVLRAPSPGELGWIVHRHGELYWREYGWGASFEALAAKVIADLAEANEQTTPVRTAAWIAELDGQRAGSVVCMRDDDRTARLRLLLVEPAARGHGIGELLVDECIGFARAAGYEHLVLWTNEPLRHARPIYERAGFELVGEAAHTRFGPEIVGQDWRLRL